MWYLNVARIVAVSGVLFSAGCAVRETSADRTVLATPHKKEQRSDEWKAASFKGIVVGRSTRQEALNVLGKPVTTETSANDLPVEAGRFVNDEYKSDLMEGRLVVTASEKTGIVDVITIYPSNLSLEAAAGIFGGDYKKSNYEVLECPGDAGSSLIREAPGGDIEYLEYRSKGIVMTSDGHDKISSVEFVKGPLGVTSCP